MVASVPSNVPQESMEGFSAQLLQEVIKADINMHAYQIQAWQHFFATRPLGNDLPVDIAAGFAQQYFLNMHEMQLQFSLRPQRRTFWQRLRIGLAIIFKRNYNLLPIALQSLVVAKEVKFETLNVVFMISRGKDGGLTIDQTISEGMA